jgi:hypothetical protein
MNRPNANASSRSGHLTLQSLRPIYEELNFWTSREDSLSIGTEEVKKIIKQLINTAEEIHFGTGDTTTVEISANNIEATVRNPQTQMKDTITLKREDYPFIHKAKNKASSDLYSKETCLATALDALKERLKSTDQFDPNLIPQHSIEKTPDERFDALYDNVEQTNKKLRP